MTRRRLTKVDGAGMSNGSRIGLQFDLQVKTTTRRSSGKAARQAAAFRGRAQRKSNLPAHMEQYMWNRGDADKSRFRA